MLLGGKFTYNKRVTLSEIFKLPNHGIFVRGETIPPPLSRPCVLFVLPFFFFKSNGAFLFAILRLLVAKKELTPRRLFCKVRTASVLIMF